MVENNIQMLYKLRVGRVRDDAMVDGNAGNGSSIR